VTLVILSFKCSFCLVFGLCPQNQGHGLLVDGHPLWIMGTLPLNLSRIHMSLYSEHRQRHGEEASSFRAVMSSCSASWTCVVVKSNFVNDHHALLCQCNGHQFPFCYARARRDAVRPAAGQIPSTLPGGCLVFGLCPRNQGHGLLVDGHPLWIMRTLPLNLMLRSRPQIYSCPDILFVQMGSLFAESV